MHLMMKMNECVNGPLIKGSVDMEFSELLKDIYLMPSPSQEYEGTLP